MAYYKLTTDLPGGTKYISVTDARICTISDDVGFTSPRPGLMCYIFASAI